MTRRRAATKIEFSFSRLEARIENGGGGGDRWRSGPSRLVRLEAMRERQWVREKGANCAFYTLTSGGLEAGP